MRIVENCELALLAPSDNLVGDVRRVMSQPPSFLADELENGAPIGLTNLAFNNLLYNPRGHYHVPGTPGTCVHPVVCSSRQVHQITAVL